MDIKLTARCRGLTGALTSESFKMSVPEVSISLTNQTRVSLCVLVPGFERSKFCIQLTTSRGVSLAICIKKKKRGEMAGITTTQEIQRLRKPQ